MILNRKFGSYVLLKRIGIGGMAELFLALKLGPGPFDKFAVVKCILAQYNDDPDYVRLFYHEAEISARLHHSNVVHTYDCGIHDDTHYMVMEHMDGVTVAEMAERGAELALPLPQDYAIKIGIDACEGLHYLHTLHDHDGRQLGIVHRDISPQNIFVEYSGIAKIFDFGIARLNRDQEDDPHQGMLAGKYAYMSPEQCRGEAVDARSDVFSLGIILYELTTGHRLFKRDNQIDTLKAITEERVPSPSSLLERYPRFLERVLLKALAFDPAERYTDALELSEDLRKFLKISGSKPSAQLVGAYLDKLFDREIRAEQRFRRAALQAAEQTFGRYDPLAELLRRRAESASEEVDWSNDTELEPEPDDHQLPQPRPEAVELSKSTIEVAVARPVQRATEPTRLAQVELAVESEGTNPSLRRAHSVNRLLILLALTAILAGLVAIVLLLSFNRQTEAPVPVAAQAGSSKTTTISLSTRPLGAQVVLNGQAVEKRTPVELRLTPQAVVEIELHLEGYQSIFEDLEVGPSEQPRSLVFELQKAPASAPLGAQLALESSPRMVVARVDGELVTALPPTALSGLEKNQAHSLLLYAVGHETLILPFELDADRLDADVTLNKLEPADTATLWVDSWPRGAMVFVNERFAGVTPMPPLLVPAEKSLLLGMRLDAVELRDKLVLSKGTPRLHAPNFEAVENPTQFGELSVRVGQVAEVFVDGVPFGPAPVGPVRLSAGRHFVELYGSNDASRHLELVEVLPDETLELQLEIPELPLELKSLSPRRVFLGDEELGVTPLNHSLAVGLHRLRLLGEEDSIELWLPVSPSDRSLSLMLNE